MPRLAPMTTPMACVKEIRPALTKPISVTVVAVEDWASAVIRAPESKALMGLTAEVSAGTVNGLALIYRWFSKD